MGPYNDYNSYNDEAPELEPTLEEMEADYVGGIIECADQAPPLLLDETMIDAMIEDELVRRAHTPFRRSASFQTTATSRRAA